MFSAEWLALREPADAAARSKSLSRSIVGARQTAPMRIVDLAAGTGANTRYLAGIVPAGEWLLVDHDVSLLALVPERMSAWARAMGRSVSTAGGVVTVKKSDQSEHRLTVRRADLSDLDDPRLFENRDLVTASALLDLVSEAWLRRLAARCRAAGASGLFALTYDGRVECEPVDPADEMIRDLVNRHQRNDKGFGPAAGPAAVAVAERCFAAEGFRVLRARSDWRLSADMGELQRQLIEGWTRASTDLAADEAGAIAEWRRRRLACVDGGRLRIIVGHEDLAAILETER